MDWIFDNSFDTVLRNDVQSVPTERYGYLMDWSIGSGSYVLSQTTDIPPPERSANRSPNMEPNEEAEEAWPMVWRAVPTQLSDLPMMKDNLDGSVYSRYFSLPQVTESTWASLQEFLRFALERNPWQSMNLSNFPSTQRLEQFIDLYFVHFDKVKP